MLSLERCRATITGKKKYLWLCLSSAFVELLLPVTISPSHQVPRESPDGSHGCFDKEYSQVPLLSSLTLTFFGDVFFELLDSMNPS